MPLFLGKNWIGPHIFYCNQLTFQKPNLLLINFLFPRKPWVNVIQKNAWVTFYILLWSTDQGKIVILYQNYDYSPLGESYQMSSVNKITRFTKLCLSFRIATNKKRKNKNLKKPRSVHLAVINTDKVFKSSKFFEGCLL